LRHHSGVLALLAAFALMAGYPPPSSQGLRPANGYSWMCEDSPTGCGHIPSRLRHPLHLPTLAPGEPCPVSQWHPSTGPFGAGLGTGPAQPVGFKSDSSLDFVFGDPNLTPPPWRGQKVLWARAPSYRGPLLIRGHQLDGTWWVGFEYGQPLQELQIRPLPASVKGWQGLPTATRIRSAGCYAYQVDGTTFSRVIVFRANVP